VPLGRAAQGETLALFNWLMGSLPLLTSLVAPSTTHQEAQPLAGAAAPANGLQPSAAALAHTEALAMSVSFLTNAVTKCLLNAECQAALQSQWEQVWQLLLPAAELTADLLRQSDCTFFAPMEGPDGTVDARAWSLTGTLIVLGE
jgi:hypothetical protein